MLLPCIQKESFPKSFTLARNTSKYNGSTKPEDWLTDYTTDKGNKRVAVRYAPSCFSAQPRPSLTACRLAA